MRFPVLGLLVASALAGLSGSAAMAQTCSRSCLEDVLAKYMAAVARHDPAAAPIGAGYRETDNAVATPAGEGVWKTVTGLGKVQRHYMDPVTGGVGYFGTVTEGDKGAIVTVRLLVEDRKVIEAEWIIGRLDTGSPTAPGPGQTSIEGLENTPPPTGLMPKAKRVPRRVMIAAANALFDSGQAGNEKLFPGAPNYIRLENGIGTGEGPGGAARGGVGTYPGREAARRAGAGPGGGPPAGGPPPGGANANRDVCGGICNVAARRYPIVDEEAGVVLAIVVFQRPPGNANRRNLLSEWFTVEDGRVTSIYAAMHYLNPTAAAPNWPPYDGNFPLSFNVGISPTPGAGVAAGMPAPMPPTGPPAAPPTTAPKAQ